MGKGGGGAGRGVDFVRNACYHSNSKPNTVSVKETGMKTYTAVVERCPDTGLYVGYVPGFRGAHSQGETLDELHRNLQEVIEMLLEDGEPQLEAEFVGTATVKVA